MIKELALRKLASDQYDDSTLANAALASGIAIGGLNLSRKYGTNFARWGDKHINSILKDPKATKLAKLYALKMPKNKWARTAGALTIKSLGPALAAYGLGTVINRANKREDYV